MPMRLILASASPRRVELLTAAGFVFDTLAVDIDETPLGGEPPDRYVRRLAAEKSARALQQVGAGAGADLHVGTENVRPATASAAGVPIVLGADTTVVVDGAILAKPVDDDDARAMLRRLSGRTHQVLTGISLRQDAYEVGRVESTDVQFAPLTAEAIEWYVGTGEGRDKAGAYAIQGYASRFIPRIVGSYSNVVGLPVAAVRELLEEFGRRPSAQRAR